jgi:hypothetical protein
MGIEVQPARHARQVARIGPGDRLQHQHGIFDAACHRTELSSDQHSVIAPVRGTRP